MIQFGQRWRDFEAYHLYGDGECNGMVLRAWAQNHQLSYADKIALCFAFSITYCVPSAIVIFLQWPKIVLDVDGWSASNKGELIFQSDRKYIRMKDAFVKCLHFYKANHKSIETMLACPEWDLRILEPMVEQWPYFGRFSAYLFLETAHWLIEAQVINAPMDWSRGDTATSGLLNVYCFDSEANQFDQTGQLPLGFDNEVLQHMLEPLAAEIVQRGGNDNITMLETSLCAYRKFFKASRYNGFYLDRMLGELNSMKIQFPVICAELFAIRDQLFDSKYLGEQHGWEGIRPECKKIYLAQGVLT